MSLRFNHSLDVVYSHLDACVAAIPARDRPGFFGGIWGALARESVEMRDLVEEGEEWAVEGARVVNTALMSLGRKLTEKAYIKSGAYEADNINSQSEE